MNPDIIMHLNWAINTIRDKLMFGRDELGAALSREARAKGVMIDAVKYIEELEAKNKIMVEALEFYADNRNWKVCSGESWLSTLNKEDCSLLNAGGGRARVALKINRGEL